MICVNRVYDPRLLGSKTTLRFTLYGALLPTQSFFSLFFFPWLAWVLAVIWSHKFQASTILDDIYCVCSRYIACFFGYIPAHFYTYVMLMVLVPKYLAPFFFEKNYYHDRVVKRSILTFSIICLGKKPCSKFRRARWNFGLSVSVRTRTRSESHQSSHLSKKVRKN